MLSISILKAARLSVEDLLKKGTRYGQDRPNIGIALHVSIGSVIEDAAS
jgi:hypothetical protein